MNGPLPLYHKVYLLLRQRLIDGVYAVDQALPGEHALAREYGCSRLTVRRALDALAAEGLVSRRQGRGTYAQMPPQLAAPQQGGDVAALVRRINDMGSHTQVRLLEAVMEPANAAVAACLEVATGSLVQRALRVRSYEGVPFSYLKTYVPGDIGRRITRKALGTRPLHRILDELGVSISRAQQSVTAVLADPSAAEALELPVGAALLQIRRLVRDAAGRPVEYLDARYRPDRYEYRLDMTAHSRAGVPLWRSAAPAAG
jgi:GntR family transcriptional regulator